jgi:phosphoglycerol transferase MdoB-like AlkP superfamily enzyme
MNFKNFHKSFFVIKVFLFCVFILLIERFIFLALFYDYYSDVSFFEFIKAFLIGFLTDGISVVYFLLPTWLILVFFNVNHKLVRTLSLIWFVFGFFIINLLNLSDLGYYPITKKRMGSEILDMTGEIPSLMSSYLISYWYLVVLLLLLSYFSFMIFKKMLFNYKNQNISFSFKITNVLVLLILFFTIMRGGYGIRPFTPFDIPSLVDPKLQWLASNTPFQFIHTLENKNIKTENYFSQEEAETIINYKKSFVGKEFKKKNVLFIILESFCSERVGLYNPLIKQYTPFIDSLYSVSRTYMYGMANGRMTIDALPSVLSGIPSFMEKNYCYSNYSNNPIHGISSYLNSEGYTTAFFYGGVKTTFGFENFMNINFTHNYFDQRDFSKTYENEGWGVDDHLYLQFIAKKLDSLPQPFCASLLTLSLHHPFPIPEPYKTKLDSIKDPVLKSMRYTDISLQLFFNSIKSQPWFSNSIIAFCADHTSGGFGHFETNSINEFAIPISFFAPNDTSFNKIQFQSISQIDMYPTILEYLGYNKPVNSIGHSALSSKSHPTIQFAGNGIYHIFDFPYLLDFDNNLKKTVAFYKVNDNRTVTEITINKDFVEEETRLTNLVKAYIQVFSNKINKNEF